jgi:carboxymethylenebutenolidase
MATPTEITYPGGPGLPSMNSWWASAGDGRRPAMLILRGVAGPMDGYLRIAETVASWGFHALVHNWQLRGNSPADEDTLADLRAAYAYLDSRSDVDQDHVGLMGFCKGGTFAFLAASERPSLIGVAIFHGFCRRSPTEQHLLQPYQLVGQMRPPMLFMHGTADTQAPIETMRSLLAGLREHGVNASMHEYEGVEHGFAVTTHPGYEPDSARDSMLRAQRFFEGLR